MTATMTGLIPKQDFATGATINPFATVVIADPNPNGIISVEISESSQFASSAPNASGTLSGTGLTTPGSGFYTLIGTASQITQEMQGLVFQPNYTDPVLARPVADIATSFTLVFEDQADTTTAPPMIQNSQVIQDAYQPPNKFLVAGATVAPHYENGTAYTGPVAGIKTELNYAHKDGTATDPSLDVRAFTPDTFIVTGSGMDAINVGSNGGGNNILDGGGGSNFLTGGLGNDTFYVDGRLPTANVWSTVAGFHAGDEATIWGVTAADFKITWLDNQGAAGFTGLTGVFENGGQAKIGVTLAGYTTGDLTNGRLAITFGRTADQPGIPGATNMHIAAT